MKEVEKLMKEILTEASTGKVQIINIGSGKKYQVTKKTAQRGLKDGTYKLPQKDKQSPPQKPIKKSTSSVDKNGIKDTNNTEQADQEEQNYQKTVDPKVSVARIRDSKPPINNVLGVDLNQDDMVIANALLALGPKDFQKLCGGKAAPGSAGSNFNEIISIVIAKYMGENPNANKDETINKFYGLLKDSGISKQLAVSKGVSVPAPLKKTDGLATKLVQAYNAAYVKQKRLMRKIGKMEKSGEMKPPYKQYPLWGDKSGLLKQEELIKSLPFVLLPDGTKVSPKDAIALIREGGGGINPSDTAMFVQDSQGNIVMMFWSDKMNIKAIQANTTISKALRDKLKTLEDSEFLSPQEKEKCLNVGMDYDDRLEANQGRYRNVVVQVAQATKNVPKEVLDRIVKDKVKYERLQSSLDLSIYGRDIKKSKPNRVMVQMAKQRGFDLTKATPEQQFQIVRDYVAAGNTNPGAKRVMEKVTKQLKGYPEANLGKMLSSIRKTSIDLLQERTREMNKFNVMYKGNPFPAGNFEEAKSSWDLLHLGLVEPHEYKEGDPHSMLSHCFEVQMGQYVVNGKILQHCLGINSFDDYLDKFQVQEDSKEILNTEGDITGQNVFLYTLNERGEKVKMARVTYRAKGGQTGKTNITLQWERETQQCFKKNQNLLNQSKNKHERGINELLYQLLKGKG